MTVILNNHQSMIPRTALLVGATGLIGGHCLQSLLESNAYEKILALVRKPLAIVHKKFQQHVVDFDRLDQYPPLFNVHDVYCCLGTTLRTAGSQEAFRKVDFTYPVQTAALASKQGAEQFLIVTSLGANSFSNVFYYRVKGEAEEAITKLPFKGIYLFRPSILLGERKEFRLGEKAGILAMRAVSFAMVGRYRKYRPIHASNVAKAMVIVAGMGLEGVQRFESDQIQSIAEK
ncbi:MAG: oxidoreductase [Ignavibacteriales bacterium]|nr:oxidoreductase [Ignavibacteriales bacterium]